MMLLFKVLSVALFAVGTVSAVYVWYWVASAELEWPDDEGVQ